MPMALGTSSSARIPRTSRASSIAGVVFAALALPSLLWAAPPASTPPARPAPRTMQASAIRQVNAIKSVKAAKSKTQSKIDSRLYLAMLHKRGDARLSVLTTFRFVKTEADGRVPVDIILASPAGVKQAVTKVQALGGVVRAASVAYRRVTARVHLDDLEALAALPD